MYQGEMPTFDLSVISDWGRANLVKFNASKTQFLHLSTRHNLPETYPLFFSDTQLSPSSTLNILGLSFTGNISGFFVFFFVLALGRALVIYKKKKIDAQSVH